MSAPLTHAILLLGAITGIFPCGLLWAAYGLAMASASPGMAALAMMIFGIAFFLMVWIVPKFKDVFSSLEVELPPLTVGVLGVSQFCEDNWPLVLVGIAIFFMLIKVYKGTDKGAA